MYNCWNEALAYCKKHPARYKPDGKQKKDMFTDTVAKIEVLMRQYYYGIEAKKELWYCLVYDCRVIPEDKDPMLN